MRKVYFINNLFSGISEFFFSKTLQNTGVVFAGNIIASAFSLVTLLILSRTLGPETFGVLSLVTSITLLLVSLTDFGIAVGFSKFVTPMEDKSSKKGLSFFRVVFWMEILLGFATILFGFILLDPISHWLGVAEIKGPLILGFVIGGVLSFYTYIPIVLQALQKFWTIAMFNIFSNFLKLAIISTLFLTGLLTLWNTLYVNLFTAFAATLIGLLVIPKFFISKIDWSEDPRSLKELFSFTKWLAISYCLNAVAARMDILFLSHFRSSTEIGHYALAFQLSSSFPLLLGAVSTVLIPKVNTLKTSDQLGQYILKSVKSSILVIPLVLIGIMVSPAIIELLFGAKFTNSIPIFQILLINYLLILIINPVSFVMYALNKQKILTIINTISLVILFAVQIYLIPLFGGIGAALSLLINTIISMIIMTSLLLVFYKQGNIKI